METFELLQNTQDSFLKRGEMTGLNFQKLRIVSYWYLIATLINSFLFLIIFLNYMDLTPVGCLFMDISQLLRLYIRTI